jgi:hypothetical protein
MSKRRGAPEWLSEPDELRGTLNGLPWAMLRHDVFGTWCGYAAVPADNLFYGVKWTELAADDGTIPPSHGGLTYSGPNLPLEPADGLWWVGFDCCHIHDLTPGIDKILAIHLGTRHLMSLPGMERTYRNMAYVKGMCLELSAWLVRFGAVKTTGEVIDLERYRARQ